MGSFSRVSPRVLIAVWMVFFLSSSLSLRTSTSCGGSESRARRLLLPVRPPSPQQQQQQQKQEMRVDGEKKPARQAGVSFGRSVPRSGWNPIQNRA